MSEPGERSVSEARKDLAAVVDQARATQRPVYLSRRGRRVAAVIAVEDLERLQALAEDMSDLLDAKAACAELRETAAEPVPWEQVKADLGMA
ncbi:type II toxin-antitoxin system Phd/YefM family antitoxin [Geodermatophilus sp. SYSU D00703]